MSSDPRYPPAPGARAAHRETLPPPPPPGRGSYSALRNAPHSRSSDNYRPPPRPRSPPRQFGHHDVSRAPPNWNSYRPGPGASQGYGGDHRNGQDHYQAPRGEFSFRMDKPKGVQNYNSVPPPPQNGRNGRVNPLQAPSRRANGRPLHAQQHGRPPYARRPYGKPHASDRPILHKSSGNQQQEDFVDAKHGAIYKAVDELSDDDEEDMDISDNDDGADGARNAKRARTTSKAAAPGDSAPKWSNPDPYDALPPVEESQQKRKDVVQLIRKARVSAAHRPDEDEEGEAANDDDFIRLDSDDDAEPSGAGRPAALAPSTGGHALTSSLDSTALYSGSYVPIPGKGGMGAPTVGSFEMKDNNDQPVIIDLTGPSDNEGPSSAVAIVNSATVVAAATEAAIHDTAEPVSTLVDAGHPAGVIDLTQSPDLGTRKRTHDDQIKLPVHSKVTLPSKPLTRGAVIGVWAPGKRPKIRDTCPWLSNMDNKLHRIGVRFHMEIRDFYEYVRPRRFEERLRQDLVADLDRSFQRWPQFHGRHVYSFGSFVSGLYLPTADMDLVLCTNDYYNGGPATIPRKNLLYTLRQGLLSSGVANVKEPVEVIAKAKVPLVKFVDAVTDLKVDISFENLTGIAAIETFKYWKAQYPVLPTMVTIIKQYLLMRHLNEPVNGGIGGFTIICLIVSMLQMMPEVQSGSLVPEHHLGMILMHFFDLYGNKFDYQKYAISLNPPAYILKEKVKTLTYRSQGRLSIIDPNMPTNDISGGSSSIDNIVAHFQSAHLALQKRMVQIAKNSGYPSILEVIIGGSYKTYTRQRQHLRRLYEQRYGPCDE